MSERDEQFRKLTATAIAARAFTVPSLARLAAVDESVVREWLHALHPPATMVSAREKEFVFTIARQPKGASEPPPYLDGGEAYDPEGAALVLSAVRQHVAGLVGEIGTGLRPPTDALHLLAQSTEDLSQQYPSDCVTSNLLGAVAALTESHALWTRADRQADFGALRTACKRLDRAGQALQTPLGPSPESATTQRIRLPAAARPPPSVAEMVRNVASKAARVSRSAMATLVAKSGRRPDLASWVEPDPTIHVELADADIEDFVEEQSETELRFRELERAAAADGRSDWQLFAPKFEELHRATGLPSVYDDDEEHVTLVSARDRR